jgi:hypothetical protein
MKAYFLASFGALAASATAQDAFEPFDFNVTEALVANGVNVSALPALAALTEKRSLSSPCTAAVRNLSLHFARTCQLTNSTV